MNIGTDPTNSEQNKEWFCQDCGSKNKGDSLFCGNCGMEKR